jgi:hypothetical protein
MSPVLGFQLRQWVLLTLLVEQFKIYLILLMLTLIQVV